MITRDYRRYNQAEPVLKPLAMELAEVSAAAERCRRSFERATSTRIPPGGVRRVGPWEVHSPGTAPAAEPVSELPADEPGESDLPPRLPRH